MDESAVKKAIENIEKQFGQGSVGFLNKMSNMDIKRFSSGSLSVDNAIGGGYPYGRIIEILSSSESSGKTTMAIHACIEIQKKKELAAYIDMEHAFDKDYAENIGLDLSKMVFSQPDYGEQAIEMVRKLIKTKQFSLIVVDSVATLIPKAELDGETGEAKMGLLARLMSQSMRQLTGDAKKYNCTIIFINQMREKIGVIYGDNAVTTGGNALKFYSSIRIRNYPSKPDKDKNGIPTGNKIRAKIIKNKTASPFREATFHIEYGQGIDKIREILDIAVEFDIIKKSGSWYSYGKTKLGQGSDAVKSIMEDNPEMVKEIENKIKKML